jgi:hypothetical protein
MMIIVSEVILYHLQDFEKRQSCFDWFVDIKAFFAE